MAADQPAGTETITIKFFDENDNFAFLVHCYLQPGGVLGASGLFDPKSMIGRDGIEYYAV